MPLELGPDRVVWNLPTILNIYGVAELKSDLSAALAERRDIQLAMDNVEEFDGAGVQLLLAVKTFAEMQSCGFSVSGAKPSVVQALSTMGLSGLIGEAG
ncbi:MAG: STAS domain-containing protein [Betaproteobacteria bacterium]|jgi:anti-anti-sigma regulatory factor|nr:STAS domain-containing protein [Betaproteobacteria bacterium]